VADSTAALTALLPLLDRKPDRGWQDKIQANVSRWWQTMERQAMLESDRPGMVNPMRLVWELSDQIPDNAMVAADSGSSANWYARHLRMRGHMRGTLSGNLATMGPGVPYSIGAKFAHPDRPAVALVGDGAMQMNGMAELITVARYYQQWSDPRLVVAVLHNNDLNQVTWEMRAMEGAPKFEESQTIPSVSYAGFAASLGLQALEVHEPGELKGAWSKAFAADRPTVLDVHTDPDFPPIPPHATFEQVKDAAKAMLSGDQDALGVIRTGIKQKVQEFLPTSRAKR
jgi:pyruvate dehydrogenase (quinone)